MVELDVKGMEKKLRKIIKNLDQLKKSDAKKVMSKASRAGAKIMQPVAKSLAPKQTGFLRSQIRVRSLPRSRVWVGTQVRAAAAAAPKKNAKPPKKATKAFKAKQKKYTSAYYFAFVEFGYKKKSGKKIKGQHFMQQAFKQTHGKALEAALKIARQEFDSALKRAAA